MRTLTIRSTLLPAIMAALVLLSAGSATANSLQYLVSVDTSSVTTTSGFLDFQFNPGDSSSQIATAQITNFNAGGGALVFNVDSPQFTGDAAGTLPATVTLVNDTSFNDYFQQFTYGDFFSFVLSLSGPALDSPNGTAQSGSTFGLELNDSNQSPILTNDTVAGQVLVNLDGSTTPQPIPTAAGGVSVVGFQVIPEPGTMVLLGLASLGLMALRRSRG
jgi:hypothetical protein